MSTGPYFYISPVPAKLATEQAMGRAMAVSVDQVFCPHCRRSMLAVDTDASPLLFTCQHCTTQAVSPIPRAVLGAFVAFMAALLGVLLWARLT